MLTRDWIQIGVRDRFTLFTRRQDFSSTLLCSRICGNEQMRRQIIHGGKFEVFLYAPRSSALVGGGTVYSIPLGQHPFETHSISASRSRRYLERIRSEINVYLLTNEVILLTNKVILCATLLMLVNRLFLLTKDLTPEKRKRTIAEASIYSQSE
jgi:hypothetical protein